MTLSSILATVGSAISIVVVLIVAIKCGELYSTTTDTLNKANEVVDIVYNNKGTIDDMLKRMGKWFSTDSSVQK